MCIFLFSGFVILVGAVACFQDLDFPPGFQFGAASSSYQTEGAWNTSDKSESIWDRFVHEKPHLIGDGSTGDIACDSYHLWRRDIEMVSELGLHFYRFSISWTRLVPNGFATHISEDGRTYYDNLINGLLESGVEPMVTLYHWELPQKLQDLGGWTNPLIVDWFGDYARVVYSLFGDRVKTFLTINEPLVMCDLPYNTGTLAPGIVDVVATYMCNKNVLLAHAKAWRIYDEEFRPKYHGEVSITNQLLWFEAATPEDEELAEHAREWMAGRYSHAIFSAEGGWPPVVEKAMAEDSKKKGYPRSTLPAFTKEEIEFVRGTFDFYAVNHYSSRLVRKAKEGEELHPYPLGDIPELAAKLEPHPHWRPTATAIFWLYPEGLHHQLVWLKKRYGDIRFVITENGVATPAGRNDMDRIEYYTEYLKQVLLAIKEGVNVTGYTAWCLMDNFEWSDGYKTKMGLYEVDFSSPERTRTQKASARFYKNLIQKHSLNFKVYADEL
ncbi:myrosinase 1-like isoform X2 [Manduca sexta]|uniref:myrosinase 1-like isoform X2 n=1 Tax=Manduca sexta TaxID=7130 RepID=UPI00188DDE64|nr:myrosinase 1-like isoform X2 [Manduca sexta]